MQGTEPLRWSRLDEANSSRYTPFQFLDAPVPDVPFPRVNDADSVGKFIDGKVKQVRTLRLTCAKDACS